MEFLTTTTTNSIENAVIERYLGLVSTNVVVGTNLFSDIAASFTDIFGGRSETYQDKLRDIHKIAIDRLKYDSLNIGANAIIGLKVDFDEISGKGKSMFMLSAIGTAVRVKYNDISEVEAQSPEIVLLSSFNKEWGKRRIQKTLSNHKLPSKEQWDFILSNPVEEIAPEILSLYLSNSMEVSKSNAIAYFGVSPFEAAAACLYPSFPERAEIYQILKNNNLFSPEHVLSLIKSGHVKMAVQCLDISKKIYTMHDVKLMQEIVEAFNSLPDKGVIKTVKNMLGKQKDKYECQHGHLNEADDEYCSSCGENIKGLNITDVAKIDLFEEKIESLIYLFGR
jgi:uncharacterized protein YbjQ (UPF0145 family)